MRRFAILAAVFLLLSGQIPSGGTEGGRLLIGSCVWLVKQAVEEAERKKKQERTVLVEKAVSGDPESQYRLGERYWVGDESFEQDDVLAYKWLSLAAAAGHLAAGRLRKEVIETLTDDEVLEADTWVAEWQSFTSRSSP